VAAASTAALGLAGLAFGLWEQTRYLLWVNAHPGWVARRGALTENLREGLLANLIVWLFPVLLLFLQVYRKLSRRLSWQDLRHKLEFAPAYPIASRWVLTFLAFGAIGIVVSLWLTAKLIQAYVWEDYFSLARVVQLWALLFSSAMIVASVAREQLGTALGLQQADDQSIEPATADAVRDALIAGNRVGAIRAYRAQTGAGLAQARRQVLRLADAMYREHPERFARDPTLRAPVNMRLLAVLVLAVLAAVVTGAVIAVPPPSRAVSLGLFATGTAAGIAMALARSLRSRWQSIVAVLLAIGALTVAAWMNTHLPPQASASMASMVFGLLAGLLLIVVSRRG
jgi:hypothetical protein